MKISSISWCVGLALLGLGACGKADHGASHAGGADSGIGGDSQATGGGGAGFGAAAARAGTGSSGRSQATGDNAGSSGWAGSSPESAGASPDTELQPCMPDQTTTISGTVFDPAGENPLYNVMVYVVAPSTSLPDLDSVPVGCGCAQLLPAKMLSVRIATDEHGHFEMPCAPSGTVSLVIQAGKWRRRYDGIQVIRNQPNLIPNLRLPANSSEGSLPNIAISTGGTDSFECLPLRIGVSASEYVAGSASGGHIHIYSGWNGATPAQGAVESSKALWDTQGHLNEHDLIVLSCEGQETTGGESSPHVDSTAQQYLMNYANAGGRVLATHYHYAWFNTGPFATGANNLAKWTVGSGVVDDSQAFPAEIDTTSSTGAAFPQGSALAKWLGIVGALTNNQLPVWFAHNNVKALITPPSSEWIHLSASTTLAPSAPQLFSADTPVGASGSAVCGRVVYSALHVSGGPNTNAPGVPADYPSVGGAAGAGGSPGFPGPVPVAKGGTVPSGCALHPLTPQEAALEFMFFNLSSCLVPIGE